MKVSVKIISITLIFILSFVLVSCDFDESKNHLSGGILLDDEKMSEIKNEVLSGETLEAPTEETTGAQSSSPEAPEDGGYDPNAIVYWTEGGSVWHTSASCSHIKNSSNIFAGKISQAQNAGKSRPCSRCGD